MARVGGVWLASAGLAASAALAGCTSVPPEGAAPSGLPTSVGPLPTDEVVWAVGSTVHVGERSFTTDRPVRAMVAARGRIYYLEGRRDELMVSDGVRSRPTGFATDSLVASADGRHLAFLDRSDGSPWSTTVLDLVTGDVVVDDSSGMGEEGGDLTDLYEDAQPEPLGFEGDELFVRAASGDQIRSWDASTGERTDHGERSFVAPFEPGGGRRLPALVRRGRLVVPQDPYRSTQWGSASPGATVTLQPLADRTGLFVVDSGRRLPVDLQGRTFLLGGWLNDRTAYGVSFDRSAYGRVRLVTCRLIPAEPRCRVLREVDKPRGELVLFPTGSPTTDY